MECKKNNARIKKEEVNKLLNPKENLDDLSLKVYQTLLTKYPLPPDKEELEQIEKDKQRDEIAEIFQDWPDIKDKDE